MYIIHTNTQNMKYIHIYLDIYIYICMMLSFCFAEPIHGASSRVLKAEIQALLTDERHLRFLFVAGFVAERLRGLCRTSIPFHLCD